MEKSPFHGPVPSYTGRPQVSEHPIQRTVQIAGFGPDNFRKISPKWIVMQEAWGFQTTGSISGALMGWLRQPPSQLQEEQSAVSVGGEKDVDLFVFLAVLLPFRKGITPHPGFQFGPVAGIPRSLPGSAQTDHPLRKRSGNRRRWTCQRRHPSGWRPPRRCFRQQLHIVTVGSGIQERLVMGNPH